MRAAAVLPWRRPRGMAGNKSLERKTVPMNLAAVHRAGAAMTPEAWCDLWVRAAGGEHVGLPLPAFPPEDVQKITNSISGPDTMRHAGRFYRIADQEMRRHLSPDLTDRKLLDFGGGWGRITRLFLRSIAPANLYAIDVDERLVAAGNDLLPGADFRRLISGEAIPHPSGTFDTVIANSVFSHLSADYHRFYVSEIARVLKPGGLFLGTTLGPKWLDRSLTNDTGRAWVTSLFPDMDAARATLGRGELLFADTHRWPGYGLTIVPDGWVEKNWPQFTIAGTRTDYEQDIQIAIRR